MRLQFPSGIKLRNGHLWAISTRFQNYIADEMDQFMTNYRILTTPLALLTHGTSCFNPMDNIIRYTGPINTTFWPPKFLFLKWQREPWSVSVIMWLAILVSIFVWSFYLYRQSDSQLQVKYWHFLKWGSNEKPLAWGYILIIASLLLLVFLSIFISDTYTYKRLGSFDMNQRNEWIWER